MKRKVIEISPHTFALNLPAEYVRSCNISKGDLLEISKFDHSLIISKEDIFSFSFDKKTWQLYDTRVKIKIIKYILQNGYEKVIVPYDEVSNFFLKQMRIWRVYEVNDKLVIESLEKNNTRNIVSALNSLILLLKELLEFSFDFKLLIRTYDLLSKVSFKEALTVSNNDFSKFFTLVNIVNSLKRLSMFLKDNYEYFFISDVVKDMIRLLSLYRSLVMNNIPLDKFLFSLYQLVDDSRKRLSNKPFNVINLKTFQFEKINDLRVADYHSMLVSLLNILP